jgi:feruloyl esterase
MRKIFVLFTVVVWCCSYIWAGSCESLTKLTIPNTTIFSAKDVPAGPYSGPGAARAPRLLPAYCLVTAVAQPVADSEIHLEFWLPPAQIWNGKLLGTGNGAYSGALSYVDMAMGLAQGYAVAGSDTGHAGGDLKFGLGHSEKINDWAYRAVHVMTDTAKLVVRSHYGRLAAASYFMGCSTGGQQALTEAQRFPADYDGIIAGAPGNNRVRLNVGFLWSWLALHKAGEPLPASKLSLIHQALLAACDGVQAGFLADPRTCKFDPGVLQCKAGDSADCLTASQVEAVRMIYAGARNPRTGERIFAGWALGSEANENTPAGSWAGYFVGQPEPARLDFWRYWVFNDPNWDFRTFDFDRDVAYADAKMAVVAANDPDLSAFKQHKGKLLMYHGWADPVAPPDDGIRYYESVERAMGGAKKTADFIRLFMVPGMGHCYGGPGPNTFDALGTLDRWVTQGIAPDKVIASHSTEGKVDRSRPLCPYPQISSWNRSGDINDAAAYVCVVGK